MDPTVSGYTHGVGVVAAVLVVGLYAGLYTGRVSSLARRGRPAPPPARRACLYAGLAVLLASLLLPLEGSFAAHMTQHLLLGDLAPLLVVAGLTGPVLRPVLALRPARRLRVLAHPGVALPLWAVNLYVWHLPVLYEGAVRHEAVHALEHACFFMAGALMWAAVLEPLPAPRWFGGMEKAFYVLAVRAASTILASLFLWAGRPVYDVYASTSDQVAAGAVLLLEGAVVTLVAFAVVFLRAMAEPPPPARPPAARGTPRA